MISRRKPRKKPNQTAFEKALAALDPAVALQQEMIEARLRLGLSQAQLARRMKTGQPTIARMESGRVLPSFATLRKLAEATDCRLSIRLESK